MKVFDSFDKLASHLGTAQDVVLTIGVFDGLHLGHQELILKLVGAARKKRIPSLVVTFMDHPLTVLAPPYCPNRLIYPDTKKRLLEAMGVDLCVEIRFTEKFAKQSAADFVENVLMRQCVAKTVVCGPDFCFGKSGGGKIPQLRELGEKHGFDVIVVQPIVRHDMLVKSTLVRDLLYSGEVERADEFLMRPYELRGTVVAGFRRGRTIGFPTANLDMTPGHVVPARGVYLSGVRVEGDPHIHGAMTNIGLNPTFGLDRLSVETYLLDFSEDIVGRTIGVFFLKRLRDEKKFDGIDALVEQLTRDRATSKRLLQSDEIKSLLAHTGI